MRLRTPLRGSADGIPTESGMASAAEGCMTFVEWIPYRLTAGSMQCSALIPYRLTVGSIRRSALIPYARLAERFYARAEHAGNNRD